MAQGSKTLMLVISTLMLTSLFAGINFDDDTLIESKDMETSARAAYEITLHGVLEPRETFVDQAGNTRNGIDIGDTVYFMPVIINEGDNDINEFNVRVTVTPAGGGQTPIINSLDAPVCPGATTVTGCSYNNLASGDFLGGGNYRVQAESGGDLSWTPSIPGEYTVHIEIEVDTSMDNDLTNNEMTYTVVVQHYRDIEVQLCWISGPNGPCLSAPNDTAPKQGLGPHHFALMVTAEGSESWDPREVTVEVFFLDKFDPQYSLFDGSSGGVYQTMVGESATVDVWQNVTNPDQTVTDADDVQNNPCTNGANPCAQSRVVMVYQNTYTHYGQIGGQNTGGDVSFSVSAQLVNYDVLDLTTRPDGSVILEEYEFDYDDDSCNNKAAIGGYIGDWHDIGMWCSPPNSVLGAGINQLSANVVFGGADSSHEYDWDVDFYLQDEVGNDILGSNGLDVNECLTNDDDSYSHQLLGFNPAQSNPEGFACVTANLSPGMYQLSMDVDLLSPTSTPNDATDMLYDNNYHTYHFEVVNNAPIVNLEINQISRDGEEVDEPIFAEVDNTGQTGSADQITMHARGFDLEDNLEASQNYTWYGTPTQQQQNACYLEMCSFTVLDLLFNSAVTGSGPGISVCVTDSFGAEACDSMGLDIWGHYVEDYSFSSFDLSYSLEYDRVANIHFETSASPTGQIVGAQLGQNTGAFDSVVAFDMGFSNIFQTNEMGQETLEIAIPFENTFSYELWFKRTESQPWTQVNTDYVSTTAGNNGGTVMVYSHDGSQEMNLQSGTYAIFDAVAAFPPATGVTGLTADLRPGAQVVFNWVYGDNMLLWDTADTVTLYHCTGVDCTLDMNNPVFTLHPSTTSWTLIGTDATAYTVLVQTENGNVDPATGAKLTGGSASMNVVADGSVSPAPTITSTDASVGSDSLTFTWDATSTDDVNSWIICWAGTPDIVENDFSSLFGSSCAQTSDSTTSLTVLETTMCGAACNAELYFGIAAMDAPGNVGDSGGRMFVDMRGGIVDPGDDEVTEDDVGGLDDANGTTGNVDDDEGVNEESGGTVATEGGFELKDAAVYGGILIAVIFVIVLAVILVPQLMSAAGDVAHATTMVGANVSSQHQQTTQVYQQPPQSAPVIHSNAPDPSINGEPNADGYEYLEWPQASAQWWYRLGVGLEWNVWQNQQNVVAQEPLAVPAEPVVEPVAVPAEPVVAAPQSPDASIGGEPNADGYEYLEWPQASAQWWYRITPGADWTKWEK